MEIKVGAKFNKVGTDEIVTIAKYDETKGTVIIKFSNGRSIPLSTGSLMKENKWKCVDCVDEEKPAIAEKPKKEKKKPVVKKSKAKIKDEISNILFDAVRSCKNRDLLYSVTLYDKSRKENKLEWELSSKTRAEIGVVYFIKEKKFEVSFTDAIAEMAKGSEFDKLDIISDKFIEDKLKDFLNLIVKKVNENTNESEEKTDGTI